MCRLAVTKDLPALRWLLLHLVLYLLEFGWYGCCFGFLSGFFLGVGLSLSGDFLLFFPRGAVDTRLEPWTGLHCSELYWRCPVELSAVQSRAPASSKVCQHGSVR